MLRIGGIYGPTYVNEPWRPTETGAWDQGYFCYDNGAGGWNSKKPLINVFVTPRSTLSTAQQQQLKALLTIAKPQGVPLHVFVVDASNNATEI